MNKKGFTIVELVIVIAVIAILAAVSVGASFGVTESAKNSQALQEGKALHTNMLLIGNDPAQKAVAVFSMSFTIMIISSLLLFTITDASVIDILYETVSATATVGLTRNITATLNIWGKIIIVVTMYLGRVGPISLALALNVKKDKQNIVKTPFEEISVG